jgi:hypothetical protein
MAAARPRLEKEEPAVAKVKRENIEKEFARQQGSQDGMPSPGILDVLAQAATGALNMSLGTPLADETKIREQAIAHVVHAYLRPADPRDVHASMMPKMIRNLFEEMEQPKPSGDAVTALSEVAIGFVREGDRALPSMARLMAAQAAVNFYLYGAA